MTTRFFYREVVNLRVGEKYLLKGKGIGVIRRIETNDFRVLSNQGTGSRRSAIRQMFVEMENGWVERCCPEPLPPVIKPTHLAGNEGVWLRHVEEEIEKDDSAA